MDRKYPNDASRLDTKYSDTKGLSWIQSSQCPSKSFRFMNERCQPSALRCTQGNEYVELHSALSEKHLK